MSRVRLTGYSDRTQRYTLLVPGWGMTTYKSHTPYPGGFGVQLFDVPEMQ
jgi:hypothetical protein